MHITNHGRSIEQCDTSLSQWQGQKKDRGLSRADMYVFQKKKCTSRNTCEQRIKIARADLQVVLVKGVAVHHSSFILFLLAPCNLTDSTCTVTFVGVIPVFKHIM
jgi:hypothetical protein